MSLYAVAIHSAFYIPNRLPPLQEGLAPPELDSVFCQKPSHTVRAVPLCNDR